MARIHGKYEPMRLTAAAAILGDVAGEEDVVHNVFMALAQSPDKIRLSGHLKNFLAVCVTSRAKDRLRGRRHSVPLNEVEFHNNPTRWPVNRSICNWPGQVWPNCLRGSVKSWCCI